MKEQKGSRMTLKSLSLCEGWYINQMWNKRRGYLRECRFSFVHIKFKASGRHLVDDSIEVEHKDQAHQCINSMH